MIRQAAWLGSCYQCARELGSSYQEEDVMGFRIFCPYSIEFDHCWAELRQWENMIVYRLGNMVMIVPQGLAPIHLAAQNGQLECLKVMIERYKVNVNFESASGWTPLHLAINKSTKKRGLRCVRYLLGIGADPSR